MKRKLQQFLCCALSVIMVMSCTCVAFAKEPANPVIMVHGMGASDLYENPDTPSEKEVPLLGVGDIAGKITGDSELMLELLRLIDAGNTYSADNLINRLKALVDTCQMNLDKDGNPTNVTVRQADYWTDSVANHKSYYADATTAEFGLVRQFVKSVGAKNVYVFNYDTRLDVCQTADKLNSYIKTVKKNSGAKKVTLVGCSLGGSVLSAYMDTYMKKKDVKRYVFVDPAIEGVDVARIYAGDLKITKKGVRAYIKRIAKDVDSGAQSTLITFLIALLDARADILADNLTNILKDQNTVNRLYLEVLKPLLGNVPSYWECIPYSQFNKSVKAMSDIGFLDKNTGLYTKITKYHKIQGRVEKNLKKLKKQGVSVAIFASYGMMGIPVTSQYTNHTDLLIDTKYASAGATVAKYGKKLKKSGKYVSKDKVINAKTCALPDNTWFIKGPHHMGMNYGSDINKLISNVAAGKVKSNLSAVKKKYKYTQFLKADADQNLTNVTK